MDAESGEMFPVVVATDGWKLDAPFCSELVLGGAEEPLQAWAVDPVCTLSDNESDDVLHGVDPNKVFPSGLHADASSESDSSAVSEGDITTTTITPAPATVYQLVYDISRVGGATAELRQENVIAIKLDEWSACVVNELPMDPAAAASLGEDALYADLQLTEEEQKLLTQEGVALPNNLPLTKAEERILKKVRRKIRNKQSAQDSRRRRKEYIDGLESRAVACSAQNRDLQKTVEKLEKHNMSLLSQLRQLQSLIRQTVSKGAQTSTCLLIILVSLGLIILPSFSPFSRRSTADDDYRPTGVISRNILTNPVDPRPDPSDEVDPAAPQPSDTSQSGRAPGGTADLPEPEGNHQNSSQAGTDPAEDQSAAVAVTPQPPLALKRGGDPAKPAHADEM